MQRKFLAERQAQYLTNMNYIDLKELQIKLNTLTVFKDLLFDGVVKALKGFLEQENDDVGKKISSYTSFVSELYKANGGNLSEHIKNLCENSENVYIKLIGKGEKVPTHIKKAVDNELAVLQSVADLTFNQVRSAISWQGELPEFSTRTINLKKCVKLRVDNVGKYGFGLYAKYEMFYVDENNSIVPVKHPDKIELNDLAEYQNERKVIMDNTKALIAGKPAANILLTGDAGTGKSSTVKAVANALFEQGLRIIEIRKEQLAYIPAILDELAGNPLKFILFIDDLSFLKDDDNFNALKAVLEGSVSAKSKNVVIYATSNRRHIIKETFSDREGDEIHRNDTIQELVSLSERFGLHVTFNKPSKQTYLNIVKHIAEKLNVNVTESDLLEAERFALERGNRSARVAKQFVERLLTVR